MFAVVAVKASATGPGPAAKAPCGQASPSDAMAQAAMTPPNKRLVLGDIVVRPHVGDCLLEALGTPRGRRRDPRARCERSDLGEIVAGYRDLEAHVLLIVLRRHELDRQRQAVVFRCLSFHDAAHTGGRVDTRPRQRDAVTAVERVELDFGVT